VSAWQKKSGVTTFIARFQVTSKPTAQSVGGAKVLLVAIISAVGTALAGLAAVITALAALGVLRGRGVTGKPLPSPPSSKGEHE
jgi:hypothetical protein